MPRGNRGRLRQLRTATQTRPRPAIFGCIRSGTIPANRRTEGDERYWRKAPTGAALQPSTATPPTPGPGAPGSPHAGRSTSRTVLRGRHPHDRHAREPVVQGRREEARSGTSGTARIGSARSGPSESPWARPTRLPNCPDDRRPPARPVLAERTSGKREPAVAATDSQRSALELLGTPSHSPWSGQRQPTSDDADHAEMVGSFEAWVLTLRTGNATLRTGGRMSAGTR